MARMKEHTNRPTLPAEIARRRTFAIISHPDAGKTTLTEKFLLFGGAIQMAGQVRAKGEARRTHSQAGRAGARHGDQRRDGGCRHHRRSVQCL